jgi:DNA polymerase-1
MGKGRLTSKQLIANILNSPMVAVDTETWGNIKKVAVQHNSIKMAYLSYWTSDGDGRVLKHDDPQISNVMREYLENPKYVKVVWNALFDIPVLKKAGIKLKGLVLDGLLIAQIVARLEPLFSLKHFSRIYLNDPYEEEKQLKAYIRRHKIEYGDVPLEHITPYALKDAKNTLEIVFAMLTIAQERTVSDYTDTIVLEHKLLPVVLDMLETGFPIDEAKVSELLNTSLGQVSKLKARILANFNNPKLNLNSPKQVMAALWPTGKYPRMSKKNKPTADNLALLLDGSKRALAIQAYRKGAKAISTYLKPLAQKTIGGKLHCSLNQSKAVTGRFSASKPNLQNQPRADTDKGTLGRIRECYIAPPDFEVVTFDYDQIEARLLAHMSGEQHMIDTINNGGDVHTNTCKRIFKINEKHKDFEMYRYLSKRLNFGIIYGIGADKFCITVLTDTKGKIRLEKSNAATYITAWWAQHPAVLNLKNTLLSEVAATGGITTYGNRFIPVNSLKDHAILNYKIQGSAAIIIKKAMIKIGKFLQRNKKLLSRLVLTVHDELVFLIHKDETYLIPIFKKCMENHNDFKVPITVSVKRGPNWGNLTKVTNEQLQAIRDKHARAKQR